MKSLSYSVTLLMLITSVLTQNDGDHNSKSNTGLWPSAFSWQVYDVILITVGGWTKASTPPLANNMVTRQNGHTMKMAAGPVFGNLTVNGIIKIESNQLTLNNTLTNTRAIKTNGSKGWLLMAKEVYRLNWHRYAID